MKRLIGLFCIALLATTLLAREPDAKETSGASQIASMSWIAGTWEGAMWGGTFSTYYCTPEGGKVMSYSKLIKKDKVSFYEFEVFELDENGRVIFRPFPGGRGATPLLLEECDATARKVVFENKKKDYPTRITYHRVADDRLVITLSDPFGGTDKVETFDLKRKGS